MPTHAHDGNLIEIVKIADAQADQFRVERLLIIIFVGLALLAMLGVAVFALVSREWEIAKAMLIGSGTVASCATTGFGYMYNRKLRFIEIMASGKKD